MTEHSLSDRACVAWLEYCIGYLATLVLVGSTHRLYMYFTPKIITNNYKLKLTSKQTESSQHL